MWKSLILSAILHCCIAQQYQQKVAPGVPPQQYQEEYGANSQNYQPPPPPAQPQQYQQQQYGQPQQQQQFQQQQQQQYQPPPQQQQQVPVQQVPVPQGHGHPHQGDPQLLNPANMESEKDHIQEHMEVPMDISKMSQAELQFHYFKMHDSDHNNKLDGCELIKSLIHWHEQGAKQQQQQPGSAPVGEKIFSDEELVNLIDPILNMDDHNRDGYIDYPEFVRAQQKNQQEQQGK